MFPAFEATGSWPWLEPPLHSGSVVKRKLHGRKHAAAIRHDQPQTALRWSWHQDTENGSAAEIELIPHTSPRPLSDTTLDNRLGT
jgi:hypothetical protein